MPLTPPPATHTAQYLREIEKLMLGEKFRWNVDAKCFFGRVFSKTQALKIAKMFAAIPGVEPDNVFSEIREDDWHPSAHPSVGIVPCKEIVPGTDSSVVQERDVVLLDGFTCPLRGEIKEMGFGWVKNFNGIEYEDHFVADMRDGLLERVALLFDEWGWDVTVYDGAEIPDM